MSHVCEICGLCWQSWIHFDQWEDETSLLATPPAIRDLSRDQPPNLLNEDSAHYIENGKPHDTPAQIVDRCTWWEYCFSAFQSKWSKSNFRKFWISDSSCIQGSLFVLEASRITHGMLTSQAYQSWNHATNHLCSMHSEYSTGETSYNLHTSNFSGEPLAIVPSPSQIALFWWISDASRPVKEEKQGKPFADVLHQNPTCRSPIGKHHFKPRQTTTNFNVPWVETKQYD